MTKFKLGHRTCPEPYPHCHAPWLLHHRDTKGRMPTAWLWVPPCSLSLLTNYFPGAPHGRMGCHPLDMWGAHLLSRKAVRERLVVEPPAAKPSTNSPGGRAPGRSRRGRKGWWFYSAKPEAGEGFVWALLPFQFFTSASPRPLPGFLGGGRAESPGASLGDQEA